MPINSETRLQELTLMMLYLTSWTEQHSPIRRSWKGYTFEALDGLAFQEMIQNSKGAKAIVLTDEGVKEAKALLAKYGLADDTESEGEPSKPEVHDIPITQEEE